MCLEIDPHVYGQLICGTDWCKTSAREKTKNCQQTVLELPENEEKGLTIKEHEKNFLGYETILYLDYSDSYTLKPFVKTQKYKTKESEFYII